MLVVAIAVLAVGTVGCKDSKSSAPAQNAQPVGEQTVNPDKAKTKDAKDLKGRTMPAPPPIEPIK